MKFEGRCMELEMIILSEVTQIQKDKCHIFFPILGSQLQIFNCNDLSWSNIENRKVKGSSAEGGDERVIERGIQGYK